MDDTRISHISLCQVPGTRVAGRIRLIRLADLEGEELQRFVQKDGAKIFENRDLLYWFDGPEEEGAYGLWAWEAKPSTKRKGFDHVISSHLEDMSVLQILTVPGASSLEEVGDRLMEGIYCFLVSPRVLFCFLDQEGCYQGLYCTNRELIQEENRVSLKESLRSLPVYSIPGTDVLAFGEEIFYKRLHMPPPLRKYPLLSQTEQIRDAIIKRISWSVSKQAGLTKNAWKNIREVIMEVPTSTVFQDVAAASGCSEEVAQELVTRFLDRVQLYVDEKSVEDEILQKILEGHEDLRERLEGLAAERWSASHREAVEGAQAELDNLRNFIQEQGIILEETKGEVAKRKEERDALVQEIGEKEELGERVSAQVGEKLAAAREDISSFISELIFTGQLPLPGKETKEKEGEEEETGEAEGVEEAPKTLQAELSLGSWTFFTPGEDLEETGLKENKDWGDCVTTLEEELTRAGVQRDLCRGLSAFLCAAYIQRMPLLLVGPGGEEIAHALSASLHGKRAGILDGSLTYEPGEFMRLYGSEQVVAVKNILRGEWAEHIADFGRQRAFFLITHPFAEDLSIEPRSLYSYVMPLFTELFIQGPGEGNYVGGRMAEDFQPYEGKKVRPLYGKLLSSLGLGMYTRQSLSGLLTCLHDLNGGEEGADAPFVLFPYVYLLSKNREEAVEDLLEWVSVSREVKREMLIFAGIGDE